MALKGDLTDLCLADLIQLQCQAAAQTHVVLNAGGQTASIYFATGEVVHAQVGAQRGEEALYTLLTWESGAFTVESNVAAPERSIHIPWSALLLEGLRRKDEGQHAAFPDLFAEPEPPPPPPDPLPQALADLAARTSFDGLVLVSRDGVVLAAQLPIQLDRSRVGSVAAGLFSLSGRSIGQLGRGSLLQTLIQGSSGNIIITQAGANAALVALADPTLNLGMAFLEARESAQVLAALLPD